MYKDPIYFYFIVPTLLLLLQITVYIVFKTVHEVLTSLFKVQDCDIQKVRSQRLNTIIPERDDKQLELLKQGGN